MAIKFENLHDSQLVGNYLCTEVISVAQLKERLIQDGYIEHIWYLVKKESWNPQARKMLLDYIKAEAPNMRGDWSKYAEKSFTGDDLYLLQMQLDNMFHDKRVRDYHTLVEIIRFPQNIYLKPIVIESH